MTAAPEQKQNVAPFAGQKNMIAIASGKGGVGKTWLSSTLATAFAFRGERVLLFDGDLGLANVDVQLGLTPTCDLSDVIAGRAELADAVSAYDGGATGDNGKRRPGGFDVLAGKSGSGALAALTQAELMGLIQGLRSLAGHYDRILVDLAAGIERPVTALAAASATSLIVLTDEPTSLTDAYAFIKVLAARRRNADIRIVVNMAESQAQGKRVYQSLLTACKNFLDLSPPLAGIITRDPKVKDAIRSQTALLARHPQSEAGEAASRIAAGLAG
ncbi:MAG: MinD/ParA family protein [Pseudomonadota bacterium]